MNKFFVMDMEMQLQLLLYLDEKLILQEIKAECRTFLENFSGKDTQRFQPLRYLLVIDVMEMINRFPDLGEFLVKEPVLWTRMATDILYTCLQTLITDTDYQIKDGQVNIVLRLNYVPRQLVSLNQHYYNGLVSFEGVLLTISKPTSYVFHTFWSCPEECNGSETILQHIPKVTPRCFVCRSLLFENSGCRRCGEQVTATLQLKKIILSRRFVIVDDLIPKLKLGGRYVFTGYAVRKTLTILSVEANDMLPAPATNTIPSDIRQLFQSCKGVPWVFIYCLASSLGVNVCPLNCFMHLKISLLLSLASVKANIATGSAIVNVLAAGVDSGYVGNIMSEAAKLADRFTLLGTSNTSLPSALIGSAGGVCVMPLPLYTYNQKKISNLLSTIESNEVVAENERVKLQCAVWAQGMDFKKMVLHNVASVFGFVCRGDCNDNSDDIADFVLQNAVDPQMKSSEEAKALKEVSEYIDIVAGLPVSLDMNSETLLRNYFLAVRRENLSSVTLGSMGALVATTLTSARLCRRTETNVDDAIFAVWLHVSGSPEPRLSPEEFLQSPADVKDMKKMMKGFKDWIDQYI